MEDQVGLEPAVADIRPGCCHVVLPRHPEPPGDHGPSHRPPPQGRPVPATPRPGGFIEPSTTGHATVMHGRHAEAMSSSSTTTAGPRNRGRKPDQAAAAREREARSSQGVTTLVARRPELRGVLRTADWMEESVLWTA